MFQQKKIYKTLENRNFTAESLATELADLKEFNFENVSYTGLNLNLDMLMTQHIRNDEFQLIEVQGGLAKKPYATWQQDLALAINIYNNFTDYTKAHFNDFIEESKKFEAETGYGQSTAQFKDYFEQGNGMYFHDVLHSVFDISRRLDLSIEDFEESLTADGQALSDFPLPEKRVFESQKRK
ncbi:hypothetical protein G7081_03855 [Vagococcus coleopterorum]|uniref:Uncharacterized protein n=1 Tax=Vagococcus coleopterorum TaxID=2714946 RepID=A0A6G8AMT7_9ENTE|nr:hypothetical protein [Vagococcus coleopterorum]QIL46262.1 hypothetical protein G7081_03855 [Vagococcus coleopterorum]